ncbi:MAG: YjgN family protein [Cellvibrionaceae bacterium]
MSDLRYDVVFQGEVLPDFTLEAVKESFATLFKISEDRVETIFSGARVTLKANLEQSAAEKYQRTLQRVGAVIDLVAQATAVESPAVSPAQSSSDTSNDPAHPASIPQDPAATAVEDVTQMRDSNEVSDAAQVQYSPLQSESSETETSTNEGVASEAIAGEGANSAKALDEPRELGFKFHGSGGEYFKIWIVNIVLSILTLGIYSAWAKVRNKQYFYGNTEFEGSTFSYLASPITILKGRLIAMAILIAYSVASNTPIWWVSAIAVLGMLLVSPFFVQRSLMFNARNSAYRNIRFNFTGSFKEAAFIFAGLPIASILLVIGVAALGQTIGAAWIGAIAFLLLFAFAMPYFVYRQKDYFVANSEYGTTGFEFSATRNNFFATWGKLVLWTIAAFVVAMILAGVVGGLLGVSIAGLGGDTDIENNMAAVIPMMIVIYVIVGLAYLFPFIYYSVKINNLVFNNTRIDDFQLSANYELGSYGKLVVVNTTLTLLTLGFYRPWAMVRTAQYKADHMSVVAVSELDNFVTGEEQHIGALGEEVGDFYDLDFGF